MTLKDMFRLPARVLGAFSTLIFGDYVRKRDGSINEDSTRTFPGILGLVLGTVTAIGRTVTNLIKNNAGAISTAFWMSLALGGAAALTVGLWPAALTAVANFSVYGYSIAALVGTEFAAQVAATGAVGAVLASAAVYALATVGNVFSFIKSCCTKPAAANADFVAEADVTNANGSARTLSQLGKPGAKSSLLDTAPVHSPKIGTQNTASPAPVQPEPLVAAASM